MPSFFVGCENATITVNGTTLLGKPVPREIAGRTITTAMLAFSETLEIAPVILTSRARPALKARSAWRAAADRRLRED